MIGNRVKELRTRRGMSVAELARRTKLSRVTITNVEEEKIIPNMKTAYLISKELDKSMTEVFYEVNNEQQVKK